MQITNCKLIERVQKKLLEFFVLQVTARSAADILRAGNKVALNLVVGSRTFRLAEFKDFDVAYNFAMSIQARNEELKIFVVSS